MTFQDKMLCSDDIPPFVRSDDIPPYVRSYRYVVCNYSPDGNYADDPDFLANVLPQS